MFDCVSYVKLYCFPSFFFQRVIPIHVELFYHAIRKTVNEAFYICSWIRMLQFNK